jgi:5-methylcytosine-specific restriction endonuclease McrA
MGRVLFRRGTLDDIGHALILLAQDAQECPSCHVPLPTARMLWCRRCSRIGFEIERNVTWDWGWAKYEVFQRDGRVCRNCGQVGDTPKGAPEQPPPNADDYWHAHTAWAKLYWNPLEVDHIKEIRHGGTDDLANLQVLCHRCHARKTKSGYKKTMRPGIDFGANVRTLESFVTPS